MFQVMFGQFQMQMPYKFFYSPIVKTFDPFLFFHLFSKSNGPFLAKNVKNAFTEMVVSSANFASRFWPNSQFSSKKRFLWIKIAILSRAIFSLEILIFEFKVNQVVPNHFVSTKSPFFVKNACYCDFNEPKLSQLLVRSQLKVSIKLNYHNQDHN